MTSSPNCARASNISLNVTIAIIALVFVGGFVALVTFNQLSPESSQTAITDLDFKQGGNPNPVSLVCSSYIDYNDPTVLLTPDEIFDDETTEFPTDFTWGVATSAYQIEGAVQEGGRGPSIWDTFSHTRGKVHNNSNGDIACDHYHRYKEDIAIMKEMGVKSYRFSIAWPRILPLGTVDSEEETREFDFYYDTELDISELIGVEDGTTETKTTKLSTKEDMNIDKNNEVKEKKEASKVRRLAPIDKKKDEGKSKEAKKTPSNKFKYQVKGGINQEGLDFYSNLIDDLLEAGIEPYVTLYHWDLPQALQDKGGWLNDTISDEWFPAYADIIFDAYGDRVKTWITINEPWVVTMLGYGKGYMAPGLKDTVTGSYRVAHNLLRAHAYTVELYREKYQKKQKGVIGITLNSDYKQAQCPSVDTIEYDQVLKELDAKEKDILNAMQQPRKNKNVGLNEYRKGKDVLPSPKLIHELERKEIQDKKKREKALKELDYRATLIAKEKKRQEMETKILKQQEMQNSKKSSLSVSNNQRLEMNFESKAKEITTNEEDLKAFQESRAEYEECLIDDYKQMWMASAIQWESDEEAAERAQQFYLGWFADPLFMGDYPPIMRENVGERLPEFTSKEKELLLDSHDFFGLNHYTTQTVTPDNVMITGKYEIDMQVEETQDKRWHRGESPWLYSVPWGFRKLLKWIKNRYNSPPIYVTENGVCAPFESLKPAKEAIKDEFRQDFIKGYLSEMYKAITFDEVDVKGFFYWSLLDNFEWAEGYVPRFGIVRVDYETQERTIKESGKLYSKLVEQYS